MDIFISDVDGVMTTGQFMYSKEGKVLKTFGPDDSDALSVLRTFIPIIFVTGDKKGFEITRKRIVEDMGYDLKLVSTVKRIDWINQQYNPERVIYMGDGIFDALVMRKVGYSIATSDSDEKAQSAADYVTKRAGGERAVAEACIHIIDKFFEPLDLYRFIEDEHKISEWKT